jgi:LysR family cyn operon transcriptional activator
MELRHLRCFLKIAETSSFTRAAGMLHLTQPALSHQIKQLEREVGSLFERSGRTVRLTAQGKLFRTYAERALKEIQTGVTAVAELDGLVQGDLTIGVFRSFGSTLIPAVLAKFSSGHPGVKLVVREMRHAEIERGLIDGSLDLAIAWPSALDAIDAEEIFAEPLALVVGKQHPLYRRSRIGIRQLQGLPVVLPTAETRLRQLIDRCLSKHGIVPQVMIELNSNDAALAMVRCSGMATIRAARTLSNVPDLHAVHLTDPDLTRSTGILWRRNGYRSPAALAIVQMIKDEYASARGVSSGIRRATKLHRTK